MARKSRISKEERDLFRHAAGDVQPLQDRPRRIGAVHHPLPERTRRTAVPIATTVVVPRHEEGAATAAFLRLTYPQSLLRRLRRGQFAFEDELDLHGAVREEAEKMLNGFIAECLQRQLRCIRIIHGKGNRSPGGVPILKRLVHYHLRQCTEVLAYCPAQPADGGDGATAVLLKTK